MKKDNSTLTRKVQLRLRALKAVPASQPVLETHGGNGRIFERCYDARLGCVLEKDAAKSERLAAQRPAWRVYQGDCIKALEAGIADDLAFGLVDIDPYGSPWPILEALFAARRPWPEAVQIVVNDGLRNKLKMGGGWQTGDLKPEVLRHGNNLYPRYLEIARGKLAGIAGRAGLELTGWFGYYCGHAGDMTHYWASLRRRDQ